MEMQNNIKIANADSKEDIPSILLVGVGMWGENHLRVWLKLQAEGLCRLVGVQDSDPERLQEIGREFGVRTFSDSQEGLKEADAVDIVVPTYNHFSMAKEALLAGKDILVEKPLTQTLKEAQELEKIKNPSQIFMVGHLFRYNPALNYVKNLLSKKEIGNIRFIRGRFVGFRFKEDGTGILAALASHFIYLSNYIIGKYPQQVRSKVDYLLDSKFDDFSFVRLDYGPEFSVIESDYFTPGKWRTFDIIGTQGLIFVDLLNQKVELHRKKHIRKWNHFDVLDGNIIHPKIEFQEPLYLELRHFLECIKERKEPDTGIKDGINVLRIIEAAYESSRSDKTINLNLVDE